MSDPEFRVNEDSNVVIPLRNLIALLVGISMATLAYFNIESRISQIERETSITNAEIGMNSEFRIKWPRGELGALPDDAEQNIRLTYIERKMERHEQEFDKLAAKIEELQLSINEKE
jgi:hypothetical protein